jgi:single-stranded-DNA-specific exonuclease
VPVLPTASFQLDPCDPALVDALREELRCSETLAWVLARRGMDVEQARALLADDPAADEAALHDPMLLGDMAAAVERIRFAIEQGEQIVVHGDYDADGVCSTTLLVEGLEELGAEHVSAFLPDRFSNGYGLQLNQVERFAIDGMRLLIAVDCGITAVEPIAHARDLGMDVIVCDHHRPGPELPAAILCSTRPSDYPFPELCATAVAGKLLVALGGPSGPRQHELEAIATIADCMPLVGENRALVRRGLRALRATERPGLRALAEQCGVRVPDIDAEVVGFKLAPRINAVGRISESERAYELLRADSRTAPALAAAIDSTNDERRRIEREIVAEAVEQVEGWSESERDARIYLVHGRGWHEGVVGIVASRLAERYWRPVVVVADGDPARGSGRSIDGVDLHDALASCDDLLLRWGGHAQAGGLTIDPARIEEVRARLAAWGEANIPDSALAPRDRIDAIVASSELDFALVQELERLAPYGTGWERPRLLAIDARVEQGRAIGGDGSHLRCSVVAGSARVGGIGFGMAAQLPDLTGVAVDLAVRPSINRFRGAETLQLELDRAYPIDPLACDWAEAWCAAGCSHAHADRLEVGAVIERARSLVGVGLDGADPDQPPALEPLLARPGAVDLRNRGLGLEHLAQLLGAGADVLAVVADIPRRRPLLAPLAHPDRLGVTDVLVVGDRTAPDLARQRLAELATPHAGGRLVVVDHGSLELVAASVSFVERVVVLDPPTTTAARDVLATLPCRGIDLVFGARETRFSADALRAALDVRGTLAPAYRHLRDSGPARGAELVDLLWGGGDHPRSTVAITHGLRHLLGRGLVELDGVDGLRLATPATATASSTS